MSSETTDVEPGLRPIGSLIKACLPSQPGLASTQGGSWENSAIFGPQSQARTASSSTGPAPSATGAVAPLSALGAALGALDSAAIERSLAACLPPRLNSLLRLKWSDDYEELRGASFCQQPNIEEADEAFGLISRILKPADRSLIIKEVTRALLVTKARESDAGDLKARVSIIAEELASYPEDAIIGACRDWARKNVFAPSLADLLQACQRRCRQRLAILEALKRVGARGKAA